jgi:hypothetical protein
MNKPKVEYSPAEERLLKIMRRRRNPVDSITLCDLFYSDEEKPWHGQNSVVNAMSSLIRKIAHNEEPFAIEKSERRGPHPVEFRFVDMKAEA